jgi:hypothetical protein
MEEPVLDVVEKSEPASEQVIEKAEPTSQLSEPIVEKPAKNKGGRPAGSKDKAPRRKKIIEVPVVKEVPKPEPVQPEPKAEPKPKAEPQPEPKPSNPEPEPLTPRTLLRESARHMLELKRLNETARKDHLKNAYTRGLAAF